MTIPIRWYHLLSTWIFILSVLYPFHKISTFPLNILALVGCFQVILKPFNEHYLKNIYILFIHIAPFFWIPWEISKKTIKFALAVILIYLIFICLIQDDCFHIYGTLMKEKHTNIYDFLHDRFGITKN